MRRQPRGQDIQHPNESKSALLQAPTGEINENLDETDQGAALDAIARVMTPESVIVVLSSLKRSHVCFAITRNDDITVKVGHGQVERTASFVVEPQLLKCSFRIILLNQAATKTLKVVVPIVHVADHIADTAQNASQGLPRMMQFLSRSSMNI